MIAAQKHQPRTPSVTHPVQELLAEGQSVWQDDINRKMLRDGDLRRQIDEAYVRGLTSNPSIFARAIAAGDAYEPDLKRYLLAGKGARAIVETLAVDDIRWAADLFRPLYDDSDGADGFVSIEVSPAAAHDPAATYADAVRLWTAVDRPNLMIKVPGTIASTPVIENLLTDGININITLLFSVNHYERVAHAYLGALERRLAAGRPVDRIASVASFFVSRVDALVDSFLDAQIAAADAPPERLRTLQGKAGIANAKLAYAQFQEIFAGPRWDTLRAAGARVQRPLWASTATKSPRYRDTVYIERLIGPDTITTMSRATLDAFIDHGIVRRTVDIGLDEARRVVQDLAAVGIDLEAVADHLEADGIAAFARAYDTLLASIEARRMDITSQAAIWAGFIQASHRW